MTMRAPGGSGATAPHAGGGAAARRAPLHILLVDDDALVREGTAEMLDGAGHVIVEAASAEEALDVLEADKSITLLITDNRMPGMTGAALISRVRRDEPALPILLITGDASRGDDIAPDVALLSKPFREARLLAAVDELIAAHMHTHGLERVKGIEPSS